MLNAFEGNDILQKIWTNSREFRNEIQALEEFEYFESPEEETEESC